MRRSNKRRKTSSFAKIFVTVCAILAIVVFSVYINQEDEDVVSVETVVQETISAVTPGFVVEEHRSTIINEDDLEVEGEVDEEEEEEESTNADEEDEEEESSNTDDDEEDEDIANENADEIDFSEEDSVEEEVITQIIEPVAVGSESGTETQDNQVPVIEIVDSDSETYESNDMAVFRAIKRNDLTLLNQLIANNIDIYSVRNALGYNAFHYAAHRLNVEAMRILLQVENEFNVNNVDNGMTALHVIAHRGEKHFTKTVIAANFLLSQGADQNAVDNDNFTPAGIAIEHSNLELLKLFMTWNLDATYVITGSDFNLLHLAMETCKRPVIKALIDYAPDLVNGINIFNRAPIHEAAVNNCVDGLKELILTRRISKETTSPLSMEGKCFAPDILDCLFGATPLHFAVEYSKFEAVEFLLLIQSKLQCKDEKNNMPITYTRYGTAMRTYLLDRTAWEETHKPNGKAEMELRDLENRCHGFQLKMMESYKNSYLHI